MGVVGLETAFAAVYTHLVKPGILSLEKLVDLLHTNPARRFGAGTPLEPGQRANLTVFDLDAAYMVVCAVSRLRTALLSGGRTRHEAGNLYRCWQ